MEFPVKLHVPDLRPLDASLRGIANHMVENMVGTVEDVLLDADQVSQIQGPVPVFEGNQNFDLRVNNVLLAATPTSDRNHRFQDADGTIALLDDAYGIRDTIILPEGLISVDWDSGSSFLVLLSGERDSAIYMTHPRAGQKIDILVVNNGTDSDVGDWDTDILWAGGTPPSVPAAALGTSASLWVTIRDVKNVLYADYESYSVGEPIYD